MKNKKVTLDGITVDVPPTPEEQRILHLLVWLEFMKRQGRSLMPSLRRQYEGDESKIRVSASNCNIAASTLPEESELRKWVLDQLNQKTSDSEEIK